MIPVLPPALDQDTLQAKRSGPRRGSAVGAAPLRERRPTLLVRGLRSVPAPQLLRTSAPDWSRQPPGTLQGLRRQRGARRKDRGWVETPPATASRRWLR